MQTATSQILRMIQERIGDIPGITLIHSPQAMNTGTVLVFTTQGRCLYEIAYNIQTGSFTVEFVPVAGFPSADVTQSQYFKHHQLMNDYWDFLDKWHVEIAREMEGQK